MNEQEFNNAMHELFSFFIKLEICHIAQHNFK